MLYNFFKSFIRNVLRNKSTFVINVVGFTLGITVSVLIFIFVLNELSYDKHHDKSDHIYRLAVRASIGDTWINQTRSSARVLNEMRDRYPEIENAVKLVDIGPSTVKVGEVVFYEEQFILSDSTYFDIFSTKIIEGEFDNPLSRPGTVVLSESCAEKYFGDESAIGKIVVLNNAWVGDQLMEVVAVFADMPENSHFHFDHLLPAFTFPSVVEDSGWSRNIFVTYFLLGDGASAIDLETKFSNYVKESMGISDEEWEQWIAAGNFWEFYLQPIESIHLGSDLNGEWEANGNIKYVYIFIVIGLFVIIIATINFVNLSTAKSTLRAREVGVRKVSGATRRILILQFLGESAIITFISIILTIVIVWIVLPYFSLWLEREFSFSVFHHWYSLPLIITGGILLSIINGIYPSLMLSLFEPTKVLKGKSEIFRGGLGIRNILVIIQFTASVFLIICTLVVNKELRLLLGNDLGFSKENIMTINTSPEIYPLLESFKSEIENQSGVESVSVCNTLPGFGFSNWGFAAEGVDNNFALNVIAGDFDYLKTMRFEMAEGRYFDLDHPSDSSAALLNEAAIKILGIEEPIGKRINTHGENGLHFEVVGIVKDFHYESLHSEIRPMVLLLQGGIYQSSPNYLAIKYIAGQESEILRRAEELWNEMVPGLPFIHSYFEEDYDNLYNNEEQTRQVFTVMAILSVIVACLGLFGLAAFIAQQRAKEVALRKVFGASISKVVLLLLSRFSTWLIISFLLAGPLAFWVMSIWLQNFAYRITIGPLVFIISYFISLAIAFLTIGGNTNRTARLNPTDILKHE